MLEEILSTFTTIGLFAFLNEICPKFLFIQSIISCDDNKHTNFLECGWRIEKFHTITEKLNEIENIK